MPGIKVLSEKTLATLPGGRGQSIKIRDITFDKVGRRFDIRRYYTDEGGIEAPTQKGVALKAGDLGELRKAIAAFEADAAKGDA